MELQSTSHSVKSSGRIWTALLLGGTVLAHGAAALPAQDFDLAGWTLQLPVAKGNSVQEIKGDALAAGYTSNYFYSGADRSMTFWCPVTGATTPNTHYPRSELREAAVGGDWTLAGHHEFSAVCRVLAVPSNGRIIIGQIHGHMDQAEILKLTWDNGQMGAAVEPNRASEKTLALGSYQLGDTVKYRIEMTEGILKVTVGSKSATYDYTAATWKGDTYYFKAGAYVQDNAGPGTEGGRVAFYGLDIPHATDLAGARLRGPRGGSPPLSRIGSGPGSGGPGWRILFGAHDAGGRRLLPR